MNKMNELCEMELTGRYEEKLSALKAEISAADEYIKQDNSDLTEFENRYERLDIPYRVKRFLEYLYLKLYLNTTLLNLVDFFQ